MNSLGMFRSLNNYIEKSSFDKNVGIFPIKLLEEVPGIFRWNLNPLLFLESAKSCLELDRFKSLVVHGYKPLVHFILVMLVDSRLTCISSLDQNMLGL